MSKGEDFKGAWNEGKSPELGEQWQFIDNPHEHVKDTDGLINEKAMGTHRTEKSIQKENRLLSAARKLDIDEATNPENGIMSWSVYEDGVEDKSILSKINKQ